MRINHLLMQQTIENSSKFWPPALDNEKDVFIE